jgi:hypothetical protein
MKFIINIGFFLLLEIAGFSQTNAEGQVLAAVSQFNTHVRAKNAPMAWGMLSADSKKYFNQILHTAKTAKKEVVQNLPLLDKFFVLSLRHNMSDAELKAASSYKVMQTLLDSKGMSMPSFTATGMKVVVNGTKAYLTPAAEKNSLIQMPLTFENNAWKLDFAGAMQHTTAVFGKSMGNGAQTDALVLQLLKQATTKAPDESIWVPVL